MIEVKTAILAKLLANTALSARVKSDIYYQLAPNSDVNPLIVFTVSSPMEVTRCFRKQDDWRTVSVTFTTYEGSRSARTMDLIQSDLHLALDRQSLTYTTYGHIGCILVQSSPAERLPDEDGWMAMDEFEITYKP